MTFDCVHPEKKQKKKNYKNSGVVKIKSCKVIICTLENVTIITVFSVRKMCACYSPSVNVMRIYKVRCTFFLFPRLKQNTRS